MLSVYKTQLAADAKNVYTAAQAYLTDNPGATITVLAELNTGGYRQSDDVSLLNASMSQSGGNIEIYSTVLNARSLDNNSVIFSSGLILPANAP
jgi:hypothetical protein